MAPRLFPAGGPPRREPARLLPPPAAEAKAVQYDPRLFWLAGNPTNPDGLMPSDDRLTGLEAYRLSALVYACLAFRAVKLTEAPLWVQEEDDAGAVTWLPSNALAELGLLLEQPNPDQEMTEFLTELSMLADIGECLVVKVRDRGRRVAELRTFGLGEFSVERATVAGRRREFGRFVVETESGPVPYGPEDVLYFRPPLGVSPLDAALSHVRIGAALKAAVKSLLGKAVKPSMVFSTEQALSDESFARLKAEIAAAHAGLANFGKPFVADAGITAVQLAASLKDIDLGPVNGDVEANVCMAFGLHPVLVGAKLGVENNAGFADSIKPVLALFYDRVGFPRWSQFARALTRGLLREVDANPLRRVAFVTEDVRALAPDLTARANEAQTLADIWTVDERREHTGKGPLGDAVPGEDGGRIADPAARTADQPSEETEARQAAKGAAGPAEFKARRDRALVEARGEAYEAAARRLFRAEARGVRAALLAAVPKAAPRVMARNGTGAHALEAKDDPEDRLLAALAQPYIEAALLRIAEDYAPGGAYHAAWLEAFRTLLETTVEAAGDDFAGRLGLAFGMDAPEVIQAIEARAAALVQSVTETTRERIAAALSEGRAAGLRPEALADLVEERTFGSIAAERARTIARTEVVGAIADAEWAAAAGSGVFQAKRWMRGRTTPDQRHDHTAHAASGWQPMDFRWPTAAGGSLGRPHEPGAPAGEVVRCDCWLAFSDLEPAAAAAEAA